MLSTEIRYQKGVGPKLAEILAKLGIKTVNDLIYYFPREYEDRRSPVPLSKLELGMGSIIKASVVRLSLGRTRRNFQIVKGLIRDASGEVTAVWFNQPFLLTALKPGTELYLNGRLERNPYLGQIVFVPRSYEVITDSNRNDLIVPIYGLTEGLYQKTLRKLIKSVLEKAIDNVRDPLPQYIKDKFSLPELKSSISKLHFPSKPEETEAARHRLAFDELLLFQMSILRNRKSIEKEKGIKFAVDGGLTEKFLRSLPFKFTDAQEKVLNEIKADMGDEHVMNRLLQGDVGSGKTVVALYAMLIAVQNGYQAVLMAPTEILANQHFAKISTFVKGLDMEVLILTGSEKEGRSEIFDKLASGKPLIIVGTHALIEENVRFGRLGLVVIDEQHRFGVEQRFKLREKGRNLDLLVMTATPIPRTLALTLYGDLDRSVIDELPPGRTKVITRFVQEKERKKLYEFIRAQVKEGRQVYVVCPLVEESEKLDLKAAEDEVKTLKKIFREFKVGLIHGRLKGDKKDKAMSAFVKGKINILVSTTVIEVGIDVPNSTIMVIEHAERFGLSQLHQLRGRIGRGEKQSYCFMVGEPESETQRARMEAMLRTSNGFEIAEVDLKLRGPGEFFGRAQSGLPNFRVADIINDESTIREAREAALLLLDRGFSLSNFGSRLTEGRLE